MSGDVRLLPELEVKTLMASDYTAFQGSQLWVRSSRNWSVFREGHMNGRREKALDRCPCTSLTALHSAARTRCCCYYC